MSLGFHLATGCSATLLLAASAPATTPAPLSPADQAAAFKAAGFKRVGKQWRKCDDPGSASYVPGTVSAVRDLNGDGRPEAVLTEDSSFCHSEAGTGFDVVSKQADGSWRLIVSRTGMARFLATKGTGGWPDLEVGGPGFCFPIERWDGTAYKLNRREYEGKRCR